MDWHPDGNIIAVADSNGRIQCYDSCLSCIRLQPLTEETSTTAWLDVQSKIGNKKLFHIKWMPYEIAKPVNQSDAVLHLVFEKYEHFLLQLAFLLFVLNIQGPNNRFKSTWYWKVVCQSIGLSISKCK